MPRTTALALTLALAACTHVPEDGASPAQGTPDFVAALIARHQSAPPTNPPASIHRYEYRGQTVYYVPPSCCDVPSRLYSADGEVLCSPDGGFTGRGDGRCPDFFDTRRGGERIWVDTRD